MAGIFISYRRRDASGYAGRLYEALAKRFGNDHVFMDIDTLKIGRDFATALDAAVTTADVLIALIGPGWLNAVDDDGARRLESADDFVRQEIATALARNDILVVPVLVGNASMPKTAQLPDVLHPLARRHAIELSDERWDYDVRRLIEELEPLIDGPGSLSGMLQRRLSRRVVVPSLIVLGGGAAFAIWALTDDPPDPPPVTPTSDSALLVQTPTITPTTQPEPTPTSTIEARAEPVFGRVPIPIFRNRLIPDDSNAAWDDFGPRTVAGLVYHRASASLDGTDNYLRDAPDGGASACPDDGGSSYGGCTALLDFGIDDTDGKIYRWNDPSGAAATGVSPNRAPWANGPVAEPDGDARAFLLDNGWDPEIGYQEVVAVANRDQVSIEIAGNEDEPLSEECLRAIARLSAFFADRASIPYYDYPTMPGKDYSFVRLHNAFSRGTGKTCPGPVVEAAVPDIIERTKDILEQHQT
jgi:hypothetical protein